MPLASVVTANSLSTHAMPDVDPLLDMAKGAMECVFGGFRGDFTGAVACLKDSGLHHLLSGVWHQASQGFQTYAAAPFGAADVGFACALSAVMIGGTLCYLRPELRAMEQAIDGGDEAQRQWVLDTGSVLRRDTLDGVTAMRQCQAVFDATQAAAIAQKDGPVQPRRVLAEMRIAEALLLHIADSPQLNLARSDRVAALCQLMAHGLGFKLPRATREALNICDERTSLIRDDNAFALLKARLEPDWHHDTAGSPTFTVHPIDVQIFDPAETTDDLSASARNDRRLLTHPKALLRVRTRVVGLIAASVSEDCGGIGDWRRLAERAMAAAAQDGLTCDRVLSALGIATRSGITARYSWRWTDEPVPQPGEMLRPSIPLDVAQWIARVMVVAGRPDAATPCPPRLAALVRGDTPPSLIIGSADWIHLADGIDALGHNHWHASFDQVRNAGRDSTPC